MTDAPTPPPKPPRQPQQGRKPLQKQPLFGLSKESEFVGYLVLGFGILAVISVLMIAANRFGGSAKIQNPLQNLAASGQQVSPPASKPAPSLVDNPDLQNRVAQDLLGNIKENFPKPSAHAQKPDKNALFFERQPSLKLSDIEGAWQATLGQKTGVLQMTNGSYQIIIADPNQYSYREYSSGTYTMIEDIIVFQPRPDWPKPTPPAGTDVQYTQITMAKFPVIAAIQKGKMLWQNPPQSEKRVHVPRGLSVAKDTPSGLIIWQRSK